MKFIIIFTFFITTLFAFGENLQSFEAHFVQTITDETGKVLTYKGKMHTKRPNFVLWDYTYPQRAAKKLYMDEKRAVLVQPMLEQATITKIRSGMNFFKILTSAKRVDDTHFKANYHNCSLIGAIIFEKDTVKFTVPSLAKILQEANERERSPVARGLGEAELRAAAAAG